MTQKKDRSVLHAAFLALVAASLAIAPSFGRDGSTWDSLPDWSGDWVVETAAKDPPIPYNEKWAATVAQNQSGLRQEGGIRDPLGTCGMYAGIPRMMGLPGIHEWILRPGQVWHFVEKGNAVQRIYTDGRAHPDADSATLTYTGYNLGHWDGGTLVVETGTLNAGTWLDGEGGIHSDQLKVTTRIRLARRNLLEARIRVEDPVAFTKPWEIVRRYKRLPQGSHVHDYACGIVETAEQMIQLN